MKRSKLIIVVAVVVAMILVVIMLQGCKTAVPETTVSETTATQEPIAEETTAGATAAEETVAEETAIADTEINVLSWGYYIDFALKPFEEKYGIKVNIEYFDNVPDQTNKLVTVGEGKYDVSFVGCENYKKFFELGILEPVEVSKIESWDDMFRGIQNIVHEYSDVVSTPEKICAVPYAFGSTGLIYSQEKITEPVDSWEILWDEKYSGRMAILDSVEEDYGYTALYLGLDPNDTTDETINKVVDAWKIQKPLIKTYWSTGEDLIQFFTTEEVWVANGWDGQARNMQKEGYPVTYIIPVEGVRAWVDGPFMVKGAPHTDAAYKFINWLANPEMQLKMTEEIMYSPSNSKVLDLINEETAKFLAIDKEERINNIFLPEAWDVETVQKITDLWNQVKGGL